jgi:hypothetical protein
MRNIGINCRSLLAGNIEAIIQTVMEPARRFGLLRLSYRISAILTPVFVQVLEKPMQI